MKLKKPFKSTSRILIQKIAFTSVVVPALLCLAVVVPVSAAEPLSQLVDEKAGVYLEATDLNSHVKQFLLSPLVNRFRKTQVFQTWLQSQDVINLKQGLRDIESVTNQPLLPLLNDLFGKSVGLAIFNHGPKQNPSLLLLTTVRDPAVVQKLLDDWFTKTGIKVTSSTFQGTTCYKASQQDDPSAPVVTYAFLDQTLVVSDRRSNLESTIRLYQNQSSENQQSLFHLEMYRRARGVLAEDVTGSVFLNPRAWDEHIKPPKNEIEQGVVNWWKKTGALIAGLHLKNTVAVEAVILFNSEAIDLPLLNILQTPAEIPDPYTLIPKKALAVLSGHLNVNLLTNRIVSYYAEKNPEKWQKFLAVSTGLLGGLDPVTEVSKALGPSVLFYSVPRKTLSFDAISFDGLVAMQLTTADTEPGTTDKSKYQSALENVANFLMNSMLSHHNAEAAPGHQTSILKIEDHEQYHMRWIESLGPYRPAYGINERQLVVASSPELVREFFTLKSEESLAALPLFQSWKETFFREEKQLCFLNIASIRAFIEQNSDFLAEQLSKGHGGNLEKGKKKLAGLKSLLQSFDGLFFAAGLQKTQVRVIFGLGSHNSAE
ncbi:DUF3352 domain-containing protein [Gimesia maris]|uniref:DUF3352 domain-containing protein n=1 Tax=Gimesia maris TaxID=122 RepID=UPI00241EB03A|nr:DUF3352 domain-containing protein [Gimesia maris]|tara:strand:- start:133692 stop:135491 length:1800 start_codon:yes stop_codon:yes gene_type:complete